MRYFILLAVLLIVGYAAYFFWKQPAYREGAIAPDFSIPIAEGDSFRLSDLRGKWVLLDFWGSWCGPCRDANRQLSSLHQRFPDTAHFEIVGIGIERDSLAWRRAIAEDGLSWKHHYASFKRFNDPIAQLYGVREIPASFLIDPNGFIRAVNFSPQLIERQLEDALFRK